MFFANCHNFRAENTQFVNVNGSAHYSYGVPPFGQTGVFSGGDGYTRINIGQGGFDGNTKTCPDPPPAYGEHGSTSTTSSSFQSWDSPPPAWTDPQGLARPSSETCIRRSNGPIYGSWIVQAPTTSTNTAEQLSLRASNGAIEGSVTIASFSSWGQSKGDRYKRLMMSAHTSNGPISMSLNADNSINRPFFHFQTRTTNGKIRVRLPRTFQGPIQAISRNGTVVFSEGLVNGGSKFTRLPGESYSTQKVFVGDLDEWNREQELRRRWGGDELILESSNGSVEVMYADEGEFRAAAGANEDRGHGHGGGRTHYSGFSFTNAANGFFFQNGNLNMPSNNNPTGYRWFSGYRRS